MRAQVELGPRPAGSPAAARLRDYLRAQLPDWHWEEQSFRAPTPLGPVPMVNLVARWPGPPGADWLVLAAHYDTLRCDFEFVGANDGASGVACLLELGRVLGQRAWRYDLVLAFLDGEEALVEWSEDDSLYGSTRLAERWCDTGQSRRVKAVIVLDMVGDRHLRISRDRHSDPALRDRIWAEAARLGYGDTFSGPEQSIEDDHLPFQLAGMPAVALVGFAREPVLYPAYWHTEHDTLEQVAAVSLERVGRVVTGSLVQLDSS